MNGEYMTHQYENISDYLCYLGAHTLLCSLLSRNVGKDSVTFTLEDIENERHRFINHGTMSYMGHGYDITREFLDKIPYVESEQVDYTDLKNSKYTFDLKTFMEVQGPAYQEEMEICGTENNYKRVCLFFYFGIHWKMKKEMFECLGMEFLVN